MPLIVLAQDVLARDVLVFARDVRARDGVRVRTGPEPDAHAARFHARGRRPGTVPAERSA
ncbi:MAG: hypothetical protein P8Z81_11540 [Deinococcales bacterium]